MILLYLIVGIVVTLMRVNTYEGSIVLNTISIITITYLLYTVKNNPENIQKELKQRALDIKIGLVLAVILVWLQIPTDTISGQIVWSNQRFNAMKYVYELGIYISIKLIYNYAEMRKYA